MTSQVQAQHQSLSDKRKKELAGYGLAATGVVASAFISQPVFAQAADPVAPIQQTVTSLEGLAGAIVGVALSALGFRVGVKIFNRMTVKG